MHGAVTMDDPAHLDGPSPYHAGEQAAQARAGVRERAERAGRKMIRDFMPDQHRTFFEALPFLVLGSIDDDGRPWASLLAGPPGFVTSPDARHLHVAARPSADDPLAANLAAGAAVGILGIDLATRRRNRMNGMLRHVTADGFSVEVAQSFGNCPQYIQRRAPEAVAAAAAPRGRAAQESAALSPRARALVAGADTFFIATASARAATGATGEGADVSHRGGRPGFVRVETRGGASVLTAPDFRGNAAFNTIGNIAVNPRAGLVFVDFATGDALLVTGAAEVIWDGPELAAFAGAERLLRVTVSRGLWVERALPFRWSAPEFARQLDGTGGWPPLATV